MKVLIALILFGCSGIVSGQKGTAEAGYYPMAYNGDTWTGEVVSTDDATREINLTYRKKDKTQNFTGVLDEGYAIKMKDGSMHQLKVSQIGPGTRIKVYYMTKDTKDAAGAKTKVNKIFRIAFLPKENN